MGRSLQVVADARGRLLCVGPVQPGPLHDNLALRSLGLADVLRSDERCSSTATSATGDWGSSSRTRAPVHGHLSPLQRAENHDLSAIRNAVERWERTSKGVLVPRHDQLVARRLDSPVLQVR
jgi:hypothetical protein